MLEYKLGVNVFELLVIMLEVLCVNIGFIEFINLGILIDEDYFWLNVKFL